MKGLLRLPKTTIIILISFIGLNAQFDSIRIKHTTDFVITGIGNHESWQKTEWVKLTQRNQENIKYETKSKILYSETGIYFHFYCEDRIIISTFQEDFLNLWEEDVVEVFLWPDEAYPIYFEYELSPNNFELPILVPNLKGEFMGWRPWKYEEGRKIRHLTSINTNQGKVNSWTAEFFIPFELLKPMSNVPPEPGAIWRANMYRLDYDDGVNYWEWLPIVKNFHDYKLYGYFIFE